MGVTHDPLQVEVPRECLDGGDVRSCRGPEFEKTTFPKPVEIIDGMIREKPVNIIFADTGVGKTFFCGGYVPVHRSRTDPIPRLVDCTLLADHLFRRRT